MQCTGKCLLPLLLLLLKQAEIPAARRGRLYGPVSVLRFVFAFSRMPLGYAVALGL